MQIRINLADMQGIKDSSFVLGGYVYPLVSALVTIDRLYLQRYPDTPPLYSSGVRYSEEPDIRGADGMRVESFDDILTCLKRGWGDCDDLAPWRCAELQNQGIPAKMAITWKRQANGRLFHITVRLPDGRLEDPSARLGMLRGANMRTVERWERKLGAYR